VSPACSDDIYEAARPPTSLLEAPLCWTCSWHGTPLAHSCSHFTFSTNTRCRSRVDHSVRLCALTRACGVPPHSCRGIQGVRLSRGGFVPSAPHSLRGCSSGFPRHDEILPLVLLLAAPANRSCPREMRTDHRRERDGPSAEIDRVVCAGGTRHTPPGGGSHVYVPQGQKSNARSSSDMSDPFWHAWCRSCLARGRERAVALLPRGRCARGERHTTRDAREHHVFSPGVIYIVG
jgi:hypothetical protein